MQVDTNYTYSRLHYRNIIGIGVPVRNSVQDGGFQSGKGLPGCRYVTTNAHNLNILLRFFFSFSRSFVMLVFVIYVFTPAESKLYIPIYATAPRASRI